MRDFKTWFASCIKNLLNFAISGLFGAVKGQHGEVNEHNWDWKRNYPFCNQNFFSGTVSLNGAIVAFYLEPTVYCT